MSRLKNEPNGATLQPAPLFASSWAALFSLLRDGLARGRDNAPVSPEAPRQGPVRNL